MAIKSDFSIYHKLFHGYTPIETLMREHNQFNSIDDYLIGIIDGDI